ncbi:sensor histidine kinase [Desulfococcus sp.]|uniref:sensor histidine kinase n=1 Tax=Desulfococcus sp. TaxID=2025834 RepID=UPI003593F5A3
MHQTPEPGKRAAVRGMPWALLAAGVILATLIGYLLYFNFRNHSALVTSSLNGFHLDVERQKALLGYFFIERKYDIRSLAASQEVIAYYTNKGMGMSETYGLKLNLFLVGGLMERILTEKVIEEDPVYRQIALAEMDGKILVNAGPAGGRSVIRHEKCPPSQPGEPALHISDTGAAGAISISMPVFHKNTAVGQITAELSLDTLYRHFMGDGADAAAKGFALTDADGNLLCPEDRGRCPSFTELASAPPAAQTDGHYFPSGDPGGRTAEAVLVTQAAIPSCPLRLTAWVKKREIHGAIAPWQIHLAGASFTAVVLIGVGLLIRFSLKNSLLRAQYKASSRQRRLLERKNRQLSEEIHLREAAEKKLEIQQSIRIRSDRLRSLGEMAAGIAHELSQPLTGIRGLSEFIEYGIRNHSITEQKITEMAARIMGQTDRMAHIISHVRLFAREAGSGNVSLIDLNMTVDSALSLLSTQFHSHGLTILRNMTGDALVIQANPYSLEEVVINIMNNARHALESKTETAGKGFAPVITIRTAREETAPGNPGRAVLEISDNGTGMAPDTAERIFDPFFTTKAPDKGTGLGLSICRSIVASFGGAIEFSTVPGCGTTFRIALDCASGEAEAPLPDSA